MARRGRGEGNLYRRNDGLWVGRASLGFAAGKRRRKVVYGKTRKEASERLTAVLRAHQRGEPVSTERISVREYLEKWLEGVPTGVRPSTARRYALIVRKQLLPHLGRISLAKLAPSDLSAMYAALLAQGLAPRTVGHAHRVLGRALRDAEAASLIVRNVTRLVRPPRVPAREMRTYTAEQARAIVDGGRELRLGPLFTVALSSACRMGELLALTWGDFDQAAGTIAIRRTLQQGAEGFELAEPKTASARRTIPLGTVALEALRRQRTAQAEERLRCGLGKVTGDDLIFASEAATPLNPSNVRKVWYEFLVRLSLPRLTFHAGTRHTAATLLVASGTHIRTIAERLGHSDPALTLRVYAHVGVGLQKEATAALDAALGA